MRRLRGAPLLLVMMILCAACGSGRSSGATPTPLQPLNTGSATTATPPGTAPGGGAAPPVTGTSATAAQVEQAVLDNIAANGFDSVPGVNGGLGALWINWRTGSAPLTTNWNNVPAAECTAPATTAQCNVAARTDRLTDLRYLHSLALYRSQHTGDTRYDAQITRWKAIVKSMWSNARDERGWTYEVLVEIGRLTGDQWFTDTAAGQARYYSTSVYHASCRCLYFTNSAHPRGYYRPVDTVEEAAALAEEGVRAGNATYLQQARDALQFVVDHGFLRQWHAFPYAWDNVLTASGSVNPDPTFAAGLPNPGEEVRVIWLAQEAQTLLHAARATNEQRYKDLAFELLDAITPAQNSLGLWDLTYTGYCEKVAFTGASLARPGFPALGCTKKEAGRQLVVLDAVRVAATVGAGARYDDLQRRMTAIALGPDYYAAGAGYVYEVSRDYTLYRNHGIQEDWVTTEADGIALEALFALTDPQPW